MKIKKTVTLKQTIFVSGHPYLMGSKLIEERGVYFYFHPYEELTVAQLIKIFMEPQGSLTCSQGLTTEPSLSQCSIYLKPFNITLPSIPMLIKCFLSPSSFLTKILYVFIYRPTAHAICLAHFILPYLINLIIYGKQYKTTFDYSPMNQFCGFIF
jgi:hypothetical protein